MAEFLAADNSVPAEEQSLLGVLAMVKGGGLDRYWTDTEAYRCVGGNDQLAKKFAAALNQKKEATVVQSAAVKSVAKIGKKVIVGTTSFHYLSGFWKAFDEYDAVFSIGTKEMRVKLHEIATVMEASELEAEYFK